MKFSIELSFGRDKKKNPASEAASVEAAEQKSGSWEKLWPLGLEGLLFGRSKANKPFEQNANVYKAISAIATNIQQAEIAFYKDGTNEEVQDDNLETLFYRPNPYQSWNDFVEDIGGHFAASGEFFIVMEKSNGQLAGTSRLPAQLWTDASKEFEAIIDKKTNKLVGWKYKNQSLALEEVIHSKTFNLYDRWRGTSPLVVVDGEVQLDYKALQYNQRFMDNDATPGFALTTDKSLTEEQRKRLKDWANRNNQGIENAGKMNVFDNGLKPVTTGVSQKDMEFGNQRSYSREEILGTFKTPKALFNITESLNYATFTGQMKIFWIYTLVPILRKIEEAINHSLVEPYNTKIYFAFKLDNVPAFQEDFKDKVTTGKMLWDMGFTANEINQKLNLGFEEQDWRNYWWIGFGQVPADAEAARAGFDATDSGDGNQDDQKAASVKKTVGYKKWQTFMLKQAPIENRFLSKMKRYFFQLRAEILRNLSEQGQGATAESLANWGQQDEELRKMTTPLMRQAANDGVDVGRELAGRKSVTEEQLKLNLESMIAERARKIVGVNNTVKKQIRTALEKALDEGDTITEIAGRIKDVFNTATARAFTIARTETAGAVNGGSALYYEQIGVKAKEWITAGDELVRASHVKMDHERVEPDDRFSNGLQFPGDPSGEAEEVINCRCTIGPVD